MDIEVILFLQKADAVDALRLAGLHGRNDVKAKVYNKYPELRKKGNVGLVVSISGNVKNGLIHSPSSTGVYAINLLLVEIVLIVMEELGNMMKKLELMFL